MEIWKDIPGYEGLYQISNMGRVMSLNYKRSGKPCLMNPSPDKYGYYHVTIKRKSYKVHRLIWTVFKGPVPPGLEINHKNEHKEDNRLENLNLLSHKGNCNWGTFGKRIGAKLMCSHPSMKTILQYSKNGEFVTEYHSISEAARQMNCAQSNISSCLIGKSKSACGYIWKYKD